MSVASAPLAARSYSQLSSFASCGKQYQLEKIIRVPVDPAIWFPAGTAVHAVVERLCLGLYKQQQEGTLA